jgi:hypothetical protein
MEEGLLLVHTDAIILVREIIDQRAHGWGHIVQPLCVFFFYKCLAHSIKLSHGVHGIPLYRPQNVVHGVICITRCILNLPGTRAVSSPVVKNDTRDSSANCCGCQ